MTRYKIALSVGVVVGIVLDVHDLRAFHDVMRCRVLLVLDSKKPPQILKFPGGRVRNEAPREALLRELYEEGGIKITIYEQVPPHEVVRANHRQLFYLATAALDDAPKQGDENDSSLITITNHTLGEVFRGEVDLFPPHQQALHDLIREA